LYDVVIIGGGIHGVGVAQAAAAQGYSVLVLEQTALAFGASSRSSKLIHGGLRYLESFQFSLVKECLAERELLLKLAPDLVRLVPFYIPLYESTQRQAWQLRAGLSMYSLLARFSSASRFSTVPRSRWQSLDGLDTQKLRSVFCYQDAQTDDASLTKAVMQSATSLGAEIQLPAQFIQAQIGKDKVSIDYLLRDETHQCQARVLVNASGAWVNQTLDRVTPQIDKRKIDLVQGTHILVPGALTSGIYYMEVPEDHRAVFAMPRGDATLVGTTEKPFSGDPAKVEASVEEQTYLMKVLAHYFPHYREEENQIILSCFAGLRVLPKAEGRAFDRSRETLLIPNQKHQARLLSIYGGKLTTYRATAEKVMARLESSLPQRKKQADTRQLPLTPAL
ncbi:MAG: glycerol-3-phosphate dehydrogenase, partial [Gammaproteobacteria bacterium]